MRKIVLIGAGSIVFTKNLCSDILLTPALQESQLVLVDIDAKRLAQAEQMVRALVAHSDINISVQATTDQDEALPNADYVITTFQQGGLGAFRLDIEIPKRYGVEQCVGDTLGPGGLFRAMRTIPVLLDICHKLDKISPNALLLNYVNPMAMNCWAVTTATGRPVIGLCHSVQETSRLLARWLDVPYNEVRFQCAGINHQAWFLTFQHEGKDLYPQLRKAVEDAAIYGSEPVRIELMKHFGYFVTESSGHASEYVPYFRKNAATVQNELVPLFTDPVNHWFGLGKTGGYLEYCTQRLATHQNQAEEQIGELALPQSRSLEYGSYILEAIETDQPAQINGNVPNKGAITNLPNDCCVEVPCLINGTGIHPTLVGDLPVQLAAVNRTNINIQELAVHAALTGSREALYHAAALDPLTAAVCRLTDIRAMVDEMLQAQQAWLPQFKS